MQAFERVALDRYWLADYMPELIAIEYRRYPPIETIVAGLRGTVEVQAIPVPIDCVGGFTERFLDPAVRRAHSAWGFWTPRCRNTSNEPWQKICAPAHGMRATANDAKSYPLRVLSG